MSLFRNKKKIIFGILIIIWMIIIFLFSQDSGTTSSSKSEYIVNIFIKLFIHNYDTYDLDTKNNIFNTLSIIVRKGAHMTEYAILSLLVFFFIDNPLKIRNFIIPIIFSFLYSLTDEFHQSFVSKRTASFIDCLIDTLGAVIIMIITYLIYKLIRKKKNRLYKSN